MAKCFEGNDYEVRRNRVTNNSPRYTFLKLDDCYHFFLDDNGAGYINPRSFVEAQKKVAELQGCDILNDVVTEVVEKSSRAHEIVTEKKKVIRARRLLFCTGAFTKFKSLHPVKNLKMSVHKETAALLQVSEDEQRRLSQIEAHEIHRGKGLEVSLSLALSTIQVTVMESLEMLSKVYGESTMAFTFPHLPDLAPCDFYLFPSKKKHLQGSRFVSPDKVKTALQEALGEVGKNGFQQCFQKLYERWQKCISSPKGNTLKVDVLHRCELFRVKYYTPCPQTF
ncbi:DAO domain-containing protein [Trichonephila clavipes]|nr:DAO domain-containing protein [Trichonephila clavipes]